MEMGWTGGQTKAAHVQCYRHWDEGDLVWERMMCFLLVDLGCKGL